MNINNKKSLMDDSGLAEGQLDLYNASIKEHHQASYKPKDLNLFIGEHIINPPSCSKTAQILRTPQRDLNKNVHQHMISIKRQNYNSSTYGQDETEVTPSNNRHINLQQNTSNKAIELSPELLRDNKQQFQDLEIIGGASPMTLPAQFKKQNTCSPSRLQMNH